MADIEKKWYVLRATSGKEGKVKEYVEALIAQGGFFGDHVGGCMIPTEKVVTARNGKRVVKEKPRNPGYVYVEACLEGEVQNTLCNVPNVYNFMSFERSGKPSALKADEVKYLLGTLDEPEEILITYLIGDRVKVNDSDCAFNGLEGEVEEVNNEKKKLSVAVKIFGRKNLVELGFMQVTKL